MARVAHGSAFPAELDQRFAQNPDAPEPVPLGYMFEHLTTQPDKLLLNTPDIIEGLKKLADVMQADSDDLRFSDIPAAYTYFGQFVAHDMTFFDLGVKRAQNVPSSCDFAQMKRPLGPMSLKVLVNKRRSQLQLDSIYNEAERFDAEFLRLGSVTVTNANGNDPKRKDDLQDLPRFPPEAGPEKGLDPVIGDPRNDNNLIVSQLHVAFLRAHNELVNRLRDSGPAQPEHFDVARTQLRHLYHHVLINDYLKTIADEQVIQEVIEKPICNPDAENFCLPLEFTAAAFRFGHAMIRNIYYYNDRLPLVSFSALIPRVQMRNGVGSLPTLPQSRIMQWERFVARRGDAADNPNFARFIAPTLVKPLFTVLDEEGNPSKCEVNLASMDLQRGYMLSLPTGQAIADELIARGRKNIRKLGGPEILEAAASDAQRAVLTEFGFAERTPLWFYILAEAKLLGGGNKLGPVGSTIVAEVLIAFVRRSKHPILPKIGSNGAAVPPPIKTPSGEFKLPDLLRLAGVLS